MTHEHETFAIDSIVFFSYFHDPIPCPLSNVGSKSITITIILSCLTLPNKLHYFIIIHMHADTSILFFLPESQIQIPPQHNSSFLCAIVGKVVHEKNKQTTNSN